MYSFLCFQKSKFSAEAIQLESSSFNSGLNFGNANVLSLVNYIVMTFVNIYLVYVVCNVLYHSAVRCLCANRDMSYGYRDCWPTLSQVYLAKIIFSLIIKLHVVYRYFFFTLITLYFIFYGF